LKQELERARIFIHIHFKQNNTPKYTRITTALSGIGFAGRLYCSRKHTDFINDFFLYPQVPRDDLLDAVASGMSDLVSPMLEGTSGEGDYFEDPNQRPLKIKRRVP
jgi:hypothetical protein